MKDKLLLFYHSSFILLHSYFIFILSILFRFRFDKLGDSLLLRILRGER
jgi:hypothetical protein